MTQCQTNDEGVVRLDVGWFKIDCAQEYTNTFGFFLEYLLDFFVLLLLT